MFERIKRMLIKEFIQIFRDPRMRTMIFMPPLIQLIIFGYAARTDIQHIALAVYDLDNSISSRELTARFQRSGYFDIVENLKEEKRARDMFDSSEAQVILRMNKGFEDILMSGKTAPVQLLLDGTDSNTAGIVMSYSSKIIQQYTEDILKNRFAKLVGPIRPGTVDLQSRAWFNENLESRNFYIPGVVAMLIMVVTLTLTSMSVVREKEIGTMEQIIVSPISPLEFILGKTLPFAVIGYIDMLLVVLLARFWFDVPIRGSLPLLFLGTSLYLLSILGVGLLISTICSTQQQALLSTFFFFQPAIMLSGFIFPIANMPEIVQWITYLDPLRYFMVIIRGIFLKGVGMDILWPEMCALVALGVAVLWLASNRLKKTLV